MKWFDGTFNTTIEKIASEYPIIITDDFRATQDNSKIAIINSFTEEDPRLELSTPDLTGERCFYHVFNKSDAQKAKDFITHFLKSGYGTQAKEVDLFRIEKKNVFEYSYGIILPELTGNQAALIQNLPDALKDKEVFILPLKVFRYPCPVCGNRTLQWRGMDDICTECGWEDDGTDDEDEITTPNGGDTIRSYRTKYRKLKKDNPDYKWQNQSRKEQ